jgi:hypothetical protein
MITTDHTLPGCVDWTDAQYFANRTHLSNSDRERFRRNPREFGLWLEGLIDDVPTDAMQLGTALHAALLEPERFNEIVGKIPPAAKCKATTKAGSQCTNDAKIGSDFCGVHKGVDNLPDAEVILTAERWELLTEMVEQVRRHKVATVYLERCPHREKVFLWQCTETGLPLRCKVDLLHPRHVVDVKTTGRIGSEHDLATTIVRYGYHRQAAFYLRILRGLGIADASTRWHWIFVENIGPAPRVKVRECSAEALELGERQVLADLREMADRFQRQDWQQDDLDSEIVIDLPRYSYQED